MSLSCFPFQLLQAPCQFRDLDLLSSANSSTSSSSSSFVSDFGTYCNQIRHCTSCRLRRCFDVGMREELVRTEEERHRYRQLVEINRQRRREILKCDDEQNRRTSFSQVINQWSLNDDSSLARDDDGVCFSFFRFSSFDQMKNIFKKVIGFFYQISFKPTIIIALKFIPNVDICYRLKKSNHFPN